MQLGLRGVTIVKRWLPYPYAPYRKQLKESRNHVLKYNRHIVLNPPYKIPQAYGYSLWAHKGTIGCIVLNSDHFRQVARTRKAIFNFISSPDTENHSRWDSGGCSQVSPPSFPLNRCMVLPDGQSCVTMTTVWLLGPQEQGYISLVPRFPRFSLHG